MIKKILKRVFTILIILLVIAQFFGPEKNDGNLSSVDAFMVDTQASKEIETILKKACIDCHSSHTRYPWYNNITPVNYWMNKHVNHGKEHFNVSKWNDYSAKSKDHKLEEVIREIKRENMPLPSYTWTHGDAQLSETEIETLLSWAKAARIKYAFNEIPQ